MQLKDGEKFITDNNNLNKPNNKQRLIAKMVALAMVGGSLATIGAGMYGCYKSAKNSDDYSNDPRYIASVIGMSVACPTLKLGLLLYPNKDDEQVDENLNNK